MYSKPPRILGRLGVRSRSAMAIAVALIASLVAMPTATAFASSAPTDAASHSTPAARRSADPRELLPAGELEKLLARLPLNDLSVTQLAHYLAGVGGVSVLANLEVALLSGKDLGVLHLEESLREAITQLGPGATLGELTHVEDLLPAIEQALKGKLGDPLAVLLAALAPGAGTGLESAIGSLSLDQLANSLLGSAAPTEQIATELSSLTGGLFEELGTEGKLERVLGSKLAGGFTPKSVQEVANELQSTPEAVSEELGQSATKLPADATMLTAPLTDGKLAGVAPAVEGLALGLLGHPSEGGNGSGGNGSGGNEEPGAGKGSGEGNGPGGAGEHTSEGGNSGNSGNPGTGGQGGPGGAGGSTTGTTTVVSMVAPAAQKALTSPKKLSKMSILNHRVNGDVATIVLQVPAAGRVTLAGKGVRSAGARATKAQRLTLKVRLSSASVAVLRRDRRRLRVKLEASFKPAGGSVAHATVVVTFK
jgi:hypothetical protein